MAGDVWRLRIGPGPLVVAFVLPAVVLFGIGIFGVAGLLGDTELTGARRALAVTGALVATVGVSLWLVTMRVSIRITDEHLRARLWPLFRTTVPLRAVTSVASVDVEPLGDFGGVGVKGTRRDRLLGFVGSHGVRITYLRGSGDERRLTLLTPAADELVDALRQRLPSARS